MGIPFPPILVMNLSNRTDKWATIQEDFQKQGWTLLNRIDAIRAEPAWHGNACSHLKILQIAKENNFPWVLVLEDDCFPTEGALQRFLEVLPYLWERRGEWDMFSGGNTNIVMNSVIQSSPPLIDIKGFTTHFCLVHKATYDIILKGEPKDISEFKVPIDVYYSEQLRIWTTTPYFAKQRPGKSDIESSSTEMDYNSEFDKAEQILMS